MGNKMSGHDDDDMKRVKGSRKFERLEHTIKDVSFQFSA